MRAPCPKGETITPTRTTNAARPESSCSWFLTQSRSVSSVGMPQRSTDSLAERPARGRPDSKHGAIAPDCNPRRLRVQIGERERDIGLDRLVADALAIAHASERLAEARACVLGRAVGYCQAHRHLALDHEVADEEAAAGIPRDGKHGDVNERPAGQLVGQPIGPVGRHQYVLQAGDETIEI